MKFTKMELDENRTKNNKKFPCFHIRIERSGGQKKKKKKKV